MPRHGPLRQRGPAPADLAKGGAHAAGPEAGAETEPGTSARREARRQKVASGTATSEVIAVMGARGGVGATTVAVNLACVFARWGTNTVLLDLCGQFGDVWLQTDIKAPTIHDVIRFDLTAKMGRIARLSSGPFVIPSPLLLEEVDEVDVASVSRLLTTLDSKFGRIVLDLPTRLDAISEAALRRADRILLVIDTSMESTTHAKTIMATAKRLGAVGPDLVLNRSRPASGYSIEEVADALHQDLLAAIPHDVKVTEEALGEGVPFALSAPTAGLTKAMENLAYELS